MDDVKLFWERLNSLIKQKNTTQQEVSVKCDFNPRRLQNLSGGNRLPDCFEIVKIAAVLNTSAEYLVNGSSQSDDQLKAVNIFEKIPDQNKKLALSVLEVFTKSE